MKVGTPGQILFVKIVVPLLLLYYGYGLWAGRDITWRWQEETQLADGSRIQVKRVEVREVKGGGEPFRGPLRGTKITRIHIPDGQGEVVWESILAPMILERGAPPARWTVIASPVWCEDHYKYGSPRPPYIQFDYANGQWTHRPVDPRWYGTRSNLLMSAEQRMVHDGQSLTAEEIRKFNDPVYKVSKRYLVVDATKKSNCDQ